MRRALVCLMNNFTRVDLQDNLKYKNKFKMKTLITIIHMFVMSKSKSQMIRHSSVDIVQ